MTDALGQVTSLVYDARNRLVGVVDPVNQGSSRRTTLTWGAYDLNSVTDPNGHTSSFTYDNVGRVKTAKDAVSDVTSYAYDNDGQLLTVTDPNSHVTSYAYDSVGRVTTLTLPGTADNGSGMLVSVTYGYGYNADDQPTTVTDALGHTTTITYDNLGRVSAATDALSHITSYGYDLAGNTTSVTDPLSHITSYTFDARDRLQTEIQPSGGGTTTYTYDQANRMTSLTDAVSNVTSWGYDNANRPTTETDPRGKVTTIAYDVIGRVTQVTDRDGRVHQFGYDADNRPTTEKWVSGGSTLRTITMTYDYGGRLTQVQDPDSKYAYTYDNANRLLTVDDNGTSSLPQVTLTYGYDSGGNTTSMDDSLGGRTSYTYDVRDELTTIAQSGTGVTSKRADFGYDAAMRRTTLTRYSDTSGTTTVLVTKYAYDAANRLTTLTHQTGGGTVRSQYVYTMDAANRLTSEARTWQNSGTQTDTVSYTYTNNNQLTGVTHTNVSFAAESYSYDATGNRTANTTTTGNRMSSDGTYNYGYDDEGNLTSKTVIATGNQTLYTYDYRNRLTEVDSKPSGGSTTVLASYTYDALDRRIKVIEGGVTTATLYDGNAAILDFDGSGTQTARYLQGPMIDEVLARETSGGTVSWYLSDREGTIRDISNNTGAVIDHVDYNSYGLVTAESTPASGDRWKYAGREYDAVTGLYYNRARWYDPASGRFISQDPTSFAAGDANLYRYTGNGPTNGTDPSGLGNKPHKGPGLSGNHWVKSSGGAQLYGFFGPECSGDPTDRPNITVIGKADDVARIRGLLDKLYLSPDFKQLFDKTRLHTEIRVSRQRRIGCGFTTARITKQSTGDLSTVVSIFPNNGESDFLDIDKQNRLLMNILVHELIHAYLNIGAPGGNPHHLGHKPTPLNNVDNGFGPLRPYMDRHFPTEKDSPLDMFRQEAYLGSFLDIDQNSQDYIDKIMKQLDDLAAKK